MFWIFELVTIYIVVKNKIEILKLLTITVYNRYCMAICYCYARTRRVSQLTIIFGIVFLLCLTLLTLGVYRKFSYSYNSYRHTLNYQF